MQCGGAVENALYRIDIYKENEKKKAEIGENNKTKKSVGYRRPYVKCMAIYVALSVNMKCWYKTCTK